MTIARKKEVPVAGSLSTHNGFSLISDEKLLELYATMLKCRMLQERIHGRRATGNGTGASAVARNENIAVIAGVAIDLQLRDSLAPSPGGLVPCFVKGLPLAALLAGKTGARRAGRASYASFHLVSPLFRFAAQLDRTVAAVASENRGHDRRVAVLYCRDSDLSSQELQRAMGQACRRKLPILFVGQSGADKDGLAPLAHACGIPAVSVDENDAVAIYRVATEAIAHARRGSGPTVIDCRPWPVAGRGRVKRRAHDPIRSMESYLAQKGLSSKRVKLQVISDFRRELDSALGA